LSPLHCFAGAPQSLPPPAGTQPISVAPSSQPADKYSAIADLESVFSSTSIGSGFGFQTAGVTWPGSGVVGGPGVTVGAMWGPQAVQYSSDGRTPAINMGQTVPQMFGASSAANSTAGPPSYAAVSGNCLHCLSFSALMFLAECENCVQPVKYLL